MKRSGHADLPLHYGKVPPWLAERMARLGGAITEAIVQEYGAQAFLQRISDPFWFQALGAVLGMDWHSSGITTSVLGALKKSVNPISRELGITICGGRGKHSRNTPDELLQIAQTTGLDGHALVRSSRLTAKVDNTAVQDGYQVYLHSFIVSHTGEWAVVQQGMNNSNGMARRYHWHSAGLRSFTEEPHAAVCGRNLGLILNLTHRDAAPVKTSLLQIIREKPDKLMQEFRQIILPRHHEVTAKDVDMKRLGAALATAYDSGTETMEELLLQEGIGPRTLQSLVLVSEIIHGTPSRFSDPARFSFAHGGKDGHPFPVPTKVYDESIRVLRHAVDKARIDHSEKKEALRKLHTTALEIEQHFEPNDNFDKLIERERRQSHQYGGRTVFGWIPPSQREKQLNLFDE